jgi:hypothetical protein
MYRRPRAAPDNAAAQEGHDGPDDLERTAQLGNPSLRLGAQLA